MVGMVDDPPTRRYKGLQSFRHNNRIRQTDGRTDRQEIPYQYRSSADSRQKWLLGKLRQCYNCSVRILLQYFHRATLCVSAVFAVARRPSVCLSVTFVHSIQTAKDVVKLLCRPGSPIILVFLTAGADTQFQQEPFYRGRKNTRSGKFCDFRLKSLSISETVRDRLTVAMER